MNLTPPLQPPPPPPPVNPIEAMLPRLSPEVHKAVKRQVLGKPMTASAVLVTYVIVESASAQQA